MKFNDSPHHTLPTPHTTTTKKPALATRTPLALVMVILLMLLAVVTTSCAEDDRTQETQDIEIQIQQDDKALRTLRTAVAAAQYVYATILAGGYNNYAGEPPDSRGDIPDATNHAIEALTREEPRITFQSKAFFGELADRANMPRPRITMSGVWVQVNETALDSGSTDIPLTNHTNPHGFNRNSADIKAGTSIWTGDLIRMGIISASGNSLCVILVANDSHGRVSGEGWQMVSAELTTDGYGADCGAEAGEPWYEMPYTPGTDPYSPDVSDLVTSLSNDPAKAKAYSK